jgi:diketogulonate reductase-like aldo/keto reductase
VSNFDQRHLEDILDAAECSVNPHVNQVEFNPFQHPMALQNFCTECGIVVEGYCPLAKGCKLQHPTVQQVRSTANYIVCVKNSTILEQIALKHGCEPAQILIRWSLQQGVVTIPKSTSEAHIRSNLGAFNVHLDEEDMSALGLLHEDLRVTWDPSNVD